MTRPRTPTAFGRRLRELREERGVSQQELERRSGIAHQTIHHYEHGDGSPNWTTVLKLARALGVTPDAFLGEDEP